MRYWTRCHSLHFRRHGHGGVSISSLWYLGDGPRAAYLGKRLPKFLILLKSPSAQIGSQEWEKECEDRPLDRLVEMLRRHRAAARVVPMLKVRLSASGGCS